MAKGFNLRGCFLAGLGAAVFLPASAEPQQVLRMAPRGEPVAETKLLMQGIAMPNFHGLDVLLSKKSLDADDWTFARGQALLMAECGNLLLLRPPRGAGRNVWFDRATELRETATSVARSAAARDVTAARANLGAVAGVCNRCHETFRVKIRVELGGTQQRPPIP